MIPNANASTNSVSNSISNSYVALNAFSSALAQNKWQKLCSRRRRSRSRSRRKLGKISVAKTKRAPPPLSLSFCPVARTSQSCLPAANFSQRQAQQGGGEKRAWHAFINIYDSIKVCIRHSGGRAAAAATPAAESLSPALVVLVVLCVCVRVCVCVCLFVLCFMQLVSCSIKLSHEANATTKSHSKGKNCSTGSMSREKCLKIALRSHAADH